MRTILAVERGGSLTSSAESYGTHTIQDRSAGVVLDFVGALYRSVVLADLGHEGCFEATRRLLDCSFYASQPFQGDTGTHRCFQSVVWRSGYLDWLGFSVRVRYHSTSETTEDTKCWLLVKYKERIRSLFLLGVFAWAGFSGGPSGPHKNAGRGSGDISRAASGRPFERRGSLEALGALHPRRRIVAEL
jgi:hypothetical protein